MYPIACALLLSLVIAATSVSAASRSGDPKLDSAIAKANSEFEGAMKTGDAATIAAAYKDDAVFIGVDGACTKGKAEIEKMYRARFERAGLATATKIVSKNLVVDGDLAYESGSGEISYLKEGKVTSGAARFLTVWQRQVNGDWKILCNVVLP